eukprot:6148227-Pyramimonas_sp.AAC.1
MLREAAEKCRRGQPGIESAPSAQPGAMPSRRSTRIAPPPNAVGLLKEGTRNKERSICFGPAS